MERIKDGGPDFGAEDAREGFFPQGPDGVDAHAVVPKQEVSQPDDQNPGSFPLSFHKRVPDRCPAANKIFRPRRNFCQNPQQDPRQRS